MKSCILTTLLAVASLSATWCGALPIDGNISFDGTNTIHVAWNSIPGKVYLLQSSSNIAGPWLNVFSTPGTIIASSNQVHQPLSANFAVQFYRITKLDTDGPEVDQTFPFDGSIAVSQRATVKASLIDETGINTNTISFQLGTNAPVTLSDSRLRFANGVLTYTPGSNETLGSLGDSVSTKISVADTLGNSTTNFTWSFQIELPTVPVANILYLGDTNSFVLASMNGDYFTYAYTGSFPGLTNGLHLVNTNIYTGYTRTVVAFTNYPASNTVVVLTRPTKLAELLQSGSLSGAVFTDVTNSAALSRFSLPAKSLAVGVPFNFNYNLKQVLIQSAGLTVEILTNSYLNLDGTIELSANFRSNKLAQFEGKLAGDLDFRVEAHVGAQGAVDMDGSQTLFQSPPQRFGAMIGVVPVWFDLIFELNAGYSTHLEDSADYTNGVQGVKEFLYGSRWDSTNGWSNLSQSPPLELSYLGPRWTVQGSGDVHVYLEPKLRLLVYSAVGMAYDLQPYADLEARYQSNPYEFELALYGGLTGHMSVDLGIWDDSLGSLPSQSFDFIPRTLLWQTKNLANPPQITGQAQDQWVTAGGESTFTVQANGTGPLSYRWQKYGLWLSDDSHITGTRSSTLRVSNCSSNDVGRYRVVVSNPHGTVTSQNALLTVYPKNIPTAGLVAWWTFDAKDTDWNANTTSDISGHGNTGTLTNLWNPLFPTIPPSLTSGKVAEAFLFDGQHTYVSLASNPLTSVSNPGSACVWAYTTDITLLPVGWHQYLFSFYTDHWNGIMMGSEVVSGQLLVQYKSVGTYYGVRSIDQVFTNNTWTHVCYVWDGSTVTLYVNGSVVPTSALGYNIGEENVIGARDFFENGAWSGALDELLIFNRALSANEVQAIYNRR